TLVKNPKAEIRSRSKETIYELTHLTGKEYVQEFEGYPNNVLRFDRESKWTFHPTQKPVALLEYLVRTYSKAGEVVLDSCMGSGTTAIACLNIDRKFIGFETNQEYFMQAEKRVEENTTQLQLFD